MIAITRNLIFIILLAAGTLASAADIIPLSGKQQSAIGIKLTSVKEASECLSCNFPAQVRVPNDQQRVVTAFHGGVIEALMVVEGEQVKAGQEIARIRSPGLLDMQRDYLDAVTRLRLAEDSLQRDRALLKEGIIAERRFLESKARFRGEKAAVSQRRQALQLSGMDGIGLRDLRKTNQLYSSLIVRAPLDGVVLEQMATTGQKVDDADPLYRIARLSPLWVEVHVPLEAARNVSVGDAIALTREELRGRVITVGRMVHDADQGVLVRAEISEGVDKLRPGQFVEVRLSSNLQGQGGVHIPSAALVRNQGKAYVFARVANGFRAINVEILSAGHMNMMVRGDLPLDSQIAIAGTAALKAAWLSGEE
jgi:RND family efflux transporter MFP subunit